MITRQPGCTFSSACFVRRRPRRLNASSRSGKVGATGLTNRRSQVVGVCFARRSQPCPSTRTAASDTSSAPAISPRRKVWHTRRWNRRSGGRPMMPGWFVGTSTATPPTSDPCRDRRSRRCSTRPDSMPVTSTAPSRCRCRTLRNSSNNRRPGCPGCDGGSHRSRSDWLTADPGEARSRGTGPYGGVSATDSAPSYSTTGPGSTGPPPSARRR